VEEHHLIPSRLLSVHARYYVREMRIKAYAQLLESYRSVTMKNLSDAFGVSEEFMDAYVLSPSCTFVRTPSLTRAACLQRPIEVHRGRATQLLDRPRERSRRDEPAGGQEWSSERIVPGGDPAGGRRLDECAEAQ
jgi:hypothetical protein